MSNKILAGLSAFHDNENGMSTFQTIMILAIAAIVGVAVYLLGERLVQFYEDTTEGNE